MYPKLLMKILKNIFFRTFMTFLSLFVPKKKNLLVFFPIHDQKGFSGNIKRLYYFIQNSQQEYKVLLLVKTKKQYKKIKDIDQNIHLKYGLVNMIWYILRSKHLIIDATSSILAFRKLSIIQIWHGAGVKNVGLANKNTSWWIRKSIKDHVDRYRFFVSISEYERIKHNSNFEISNAVITGLPRNDLFFDSSNIKVEIKRRYNLEKFNSIFTYAPTFRDVYTIENFSLDSFQLLNNLLLEKNEVFIVKKHPWDRFLKIPPGLSNIIDLSNEIEDIHELLSITDVLISDYSSVVTDFGITRRPIIYYLFDHKIYLEKCRSIFSDVYSTLPGPFAHTEEELFKLMFDLSWSYNPEIITRTDEFINKFHKFLDGNSSRRVYEEIKKLNS